MAAFLQFESFTMALLVAGSSLVIATLVGMVLVTWMSGKMSKMNATVPGSRAAMASACPRLLGVL